MNAQKIQHLIVLMLENRSFDHLLGYLEYPPEVSFEGVLGREEALGNRLSDGRVVFPGPNADYLIDPGPNHSHDSVMTQLLSSNDRCFPYQLTNNGFALDYEIINPKKPDLALQCFTPDRLPVLSQLAQQFAVCDHWFCSVPGATWPNRNFAHAATSDGEVDIHLRSYTNKTIFEQLTEANRDWAIYYSGFPPQSIAFTRLWSSPERNWLQRFKPIQNLYRAIQHDRLPDYAFVEPDMLGKISDSQHPGMGGEMDFRAGERLIWRMYSTLRENMEVFNKTLFLITYDEHGGFYDHVPPPQGPEWSVPQVYTDMSSGYTFKFDLLGLRVPAVLISPWITRGTIDHTIYDHTSIPATVRRLFQIPEALTPRDARANTFETVINRKKPRKRLPWLKEPFIDETARSLAEGLELRDSLAWIVREMIWEQVLEMPKSQPQGFAFGVSDLGNMEAHVPNLEDKISKEIMAEIGSQLTPDAQHSISEPIPAHDPVEGDLPPLEGVFSIFAVTMNIVKQKVEKLLEQSSLVDDATLVIDWFLRKYVQDPNVILHTVDGLSFAQPDETTIQAAVDALFAHTDPVANVWLADHQDRWLTIYQDGRAILHDQEPKEVIHIEKSDPEMALALLKQMKAGDFSAVRSAFV